MSNKLKVRSGIIPLISEEDGMKRVWLSVEDKLTVIELVGEAMVGNTMVSFNGQQFQVKEEPRQVLRLLGWLEE
jgi:hypothetical protein